MINYRNSDATWHTLLTIEAYNETPISDHLFLPIVSLGREDDKYIPWGATLPDRNGNYYYTSFSPAGYALPWLFMKVLSLPVNEKSLYLFNSGLFMASTALWSWFVYMVYADSAKGRKEALLLSVIAGFTYIFSPELLHGMGIVYWHQSIMQVTLLIQLIAYYQATRHDLKLARVIFLLMALMNPYIEWTGYVANVGFAFAEIIWNWRGDRKRGFARACAIGACTAMSFGIFSLHYLLRVDARAFFATLKARFFARNITTTVALTDVFGGYLKSFLYLWILALALVIWNFARNKEVTMEKGRLLFVMAFPVLENVIMKQHALSYTYDRMKFIFPFSFLICELAEELICSAKRKKTTAVGLAVLLIGTCGLNLRSYRSDQSYIWEIDYRENNKILAEYVNENYGDSVMATSTSVRGYINMLFGRGIYEWIDLNRCSQLAVEKGERFAVEIAYQNRNAGSNLQPIDHIDVQDVTNGDLRSLRVQDGSVIVEEHSSIVASSLTDGNWTNGVSNADHRTILFENSIYTLHKVEHAKTIIVGDERYKIKSVDYDTKWIHVTLARDADACAYPSELQVE